MMLLTVIMHWDRLPDKSKLLSDVLQTRGGGLASVVEVQSLFSLLKKVRFPPWQHIMLSQTIYYYWQEIFLFTLTFENEAIL